MSKFRMALMVSVDYYLCGMEAKHSFISLLLSFGALMTLHIASLLQRSLLLLQLFWYTNYMFPLLQTPMFIVTFAYALY